nr:cysteine desulfurase family protein [uncultured Oscillibacter sp.]
MNIYADHAASSPMRESAKAVMLECLEECGNPSSIHAAGRLAAARLERARKEMAELLNCRPSEIYFTSGGTEADNWAVRAAGQGPGQTVTSAFEHHAVLRALEALERAGGRTTVQIRPGADGVLDPEKVAAAADGSTALVSVMAANNEIGTIQPIAEIAKALKKSGRSPVFHTDAVQAVGHIPVDVQKLGVDLLSLSAHKFGGPRGAGALYCRTGVPLEPLLFGGGQERGRRPGTENTAAIAAMAAALGEACGIMEQAAAHTRRLRDRLAARILEIPGAQINGSMTNRLPGNINCRFDGVEGETLVILLDLAGVQVSTGAACSSGNGEPSHVLTALGQSRREAYGAIRISLAETSTEAEADCIADHLESIVADLQNG